jgi:hypothetical protein
MSIVGKSRQPMAMGVDESGALADPPIVRMRKLEALPGFADDCGRRLLDARDLARLFWGLRREQRHARIHVRAEL